PDESEPSCSSTAERTYFAADPKRECRSVSDSRQAFATIEDPGIGRANRGQPQQGSGICSCSGETTAGCDSGAGICPRGFVAVYFRGWEGARTRNSYRTENAFHSRPKGGAAENRKPRRSGDLIQRPAGGLGWAAE